MRNKHTASGMQGPAFLRSQHVGRAQFSDICFGGAPHGGHTDPAKMEAVFPIFELHFAEVHAPAPRRLCEPRMLWETYSPSALLPHK